MEIGFLLIVAASAVAGLLLRPRVGTTPLVIGAVEMRRNATRKIA
jgi:hypothetical protein